MVERIWLYAAIFVVIFIILRQVLGKSNPGAGGMAKKIYNQMEQLYAGRHEYRVARPEDFPHIQRAHYDDCEVWLKERGYRTLGNIEDLVLTKVYPNTRTYLRAFMSADGAIAAACYDVSPTGWMRLAKLVGLMEKNYRTLEFETEFQNGTFLRTSNAKGRQQLDEPPSITQNLLPPNTPFEEILAQHTEVMEEWHRTDEAFTPVICKTLEDVLQSQHRAMDITCAWRKEIGYLTREEMTRMAGPSGGKMVDQIMRDIEAINRQKRPGPPPVPRR